jgi:hypothetical protein
VEDLRGGPVALAVLGKVVFVGRPEERGLGGKDRIGKSLRNPAGRRGKFRTLAVHKLLGERSV